MQSLPSLHLKLGPVCYAPSPNITAKFCWHLGTCSRLVWFLVGGDSARSKCRDRDRGHPPVRNGQTDTKVRLESGKIIKLRCGSWHFEPYIIT